jgi:hypothetical protein
VPSDVQDVVPFFSADYFGTTDENNHIADGMWVHAAMPTTDDGSLTHNSYGYIRSYWNNHNDPEISQSLFNTCGVEPAHKQFQTVKFIMLFWKVRIWEPFNLYRLVMATGRFMSKPAMFGEAAQKRSPT